jgi:hypothetical protein
VLPCFHFDFAQLFFSRSNLPLNKIFFYLKTCSINKETGDQGLIVIMRLKTSMLRLDIDIREDRIELG